jgi:hypothetical protein
MLAAPVISEFSSPLLHPALHNCLIDFLHALHEFLPWNNKSATIDVTDTKTDLSYSILSTPRGQSRPQQSSFDEEIKWHRLGQFEMSLDS